MTIVGPSDGHTSVWLDNQLSAFITWFVCCFLVQAKRHNCKRIVVGGPRRTMGLPEFTKLVRTLDSRRRTSNDWFVNVRFAYSRLVRSSDTAHRAKEDNFEENESRETEQYPSSRRKLRRETERRKTELHRTELNKGTKDSLMKLLAYPRHMRFIIGVMHRAITVVWRRCAPGGVSLVGSPLWVSTSGGTPPGSGGVLPRIPGTPC